MKYLRYIGIPLLVVAAVWFAARGMYWMWVYLILLDSVIILGDSYFGNDVSSPDYRHPWLLTAMLYVNLPLSLLFLIVATYMGGSISNPVLEMMIMSITGQNIAVMKSQTELWHLAGYVFTGGLLMGASLIIPAHELVHHKKKKLDWVMGNLMLSMVLENAFAVEHVHGHHKNVGLSTDPATAKRGENPYLFFINATLKEYRDAWNIEKTRLKKKKQNRMTIHNRILQRFGLSLLILMGLASICGTGGVLMLLGISFFAKFFLEITNYMEHYGLVRIPGTPVNPRHSWNTNRRMSSILLYNLTRHSHHHEQGSLEFWKLRPYPEAPEMPFGYLTTVYIVSFFPWVYRRIMEPKLDDWKNRFASEEEKALMG